MVLLSNPNNPTGNLFSRDELLTVSRECNALVVVDESAIDYTGLTIADMVAEHENLAVIRSFSHAWPAASFRLGYMIAHPRVIAELEKVRLPHNVSAGALLAGLALMREVRHEPLASWDNAFADFLAMHSRHDAKPAPVVLVGINPTYLENHPWPFNPLEFSLFFQSVLPYNPGVVAIDQAGLRVGVVEQHHADLRPRRDRRGSGGRKIFGIVVDRNAFNKHGSRRRPTGRPALPVFPPTARLAGRVANTNWSRRQALKGSLTKIVSSRSGDVLTSATGQRISSSMRRTYLIACAGRSAQLRAPAVVPCQPSISS